MRTLIVFLMLLVATAAHAQQVPPENRLGPQDTIRMSWPAYQPSDPYGLDAADGYAVRAVNPSTTGVLVREWRVGPVTNFTIPVAEVPTGAFSVSVHPYNAAGVAPASNITGPFGRAATPKSLTGVSAAKVGVQ